MYKGVYVVSTINGLDISIFLSILELTEKCHLHSLYLETKLMLTGALGEMMMGKLKTTFSAILSCALLTVTTTVHATVIASYTPDSLTSLTGFIGPSDTLSAQTFVAEVTATVGSVSVLLTKNGTNPSGTIVVDLRDAGSGVPSDSVLGTSEIVFPELSFTPTFFDVYFGSLAITLEESAMYAISLSIPGSGGFVWWGHGAPEDGVQLNPYEGGQQFVSADDGANWVAILNTDNSFVVNAIPEPATLALMTIALIGLGLGRRKYVK